MALRGAGKIHVKDWFGLNSFADAENLGKGWWNDSMNVIVDQKGSAQVLRSPANFNTALSSGNPIYSAFDYDRAAGNQIIFDINVGTIGIGSVSTYITTGAGNTLVRSNQADAPWFRLNVNNWAFGINGAECIQIGSNGTYYRTGLDGPGTAPTISYTAGGSGEFLVGVSASYAYVNRTTGHCSKQSPISNTLVESDGVNLKVRIPVTASAESGVDAIVVFITVDGGSVPYLVIDSDGDTQYFANSTANIDISIADIFWDTLTTEPAYNDPPPTGGYYQFSYKDRIFICDFRTASTRFQLAYSGYEQIPIGVPQESYPPLNRINIKNRGDAARGGIETSLGALILGEQDSYLLSGYPSDKTSGPNNTNAITEHLDPLGWSIGTRSPKTLKLTPFGPIWLDQNKRLQLWTYEGSPKEVALPIRDKLADIGDTDDDRNVCEAEWFQHGKEGGVYVLTSSDSLYIITIARDPETNELRWGFGISDIAARSLVVAEISGEKRFFIGVTNRLREMFDPELEGAGWSAGQERFFSTLVGNDMEFCYWSTIRLDGSLNGLTVQVSDLDDSDLQDVELNLESNGNGAYFGTLDTYGSGKKLTFTFDNDDSEARVIKNMLVRYKQTVRGI
jgi:hypothetical protein